MRTSKVLATFGNLWLEYAVNMMCQQIRSDLCFQEMRPAVPRKGAVLYLEAEEEERNLLLHSASDGLRLVGDEGGGQGHQDVQHAPHRPKDVCWQSPADHETIMMTMMMIMMMTLTTMIMMLIESR